MANPVSGLCDPGLSLFALRLRACMEKNAHRIPKVASSGLSNNCRLATRFRRRDVVLEPCGSRALHHAFHGSDLAIPGGRIQAQPRRNRRRYRGLAVLPSTLETHALVVC